MELTNPELALLTRLYHNDRTSLNSVTRKSLREYDLRIEGRQAYEDDGHQFAFSAWLPLAALRAVDWPALIQFSDHPTMEGDWSAIRDSDHEVIYALFTEYALPQL